MWRFDDESSSRITYFPGSNVTTGIPATINGSFRVITVLLSHSLAETIKANDKSKHQTARNVLDIVSVLLP